MNQQIDAQLRDLRAELEPGDATPALVAAVAAGRAPLGALAELAARQQRIITSDRRSLLLLATRCANRPLGSWFATLAEGESAALRTLPALAAACGTILDRTADHPPLPDHQSPSDQPPLPRHPPLPGCQAYPAYLAWLALNGLPAAVAAALVANFAAWGGYCAAIAEGLRRHHGFDDAACAFFDFFAQPATALEQQAAAALAPAALGSAELAAAREYGTLLQAYERLFWETLAALPTG
ncbi:transcriptional regulator [Streptomyces sp. CB01881]|uniref:transcriptional regulator n=1 Tax=Streptomyces sp. CB01881 TaxID=2078691 RepID=UPI0019D5BC07|nr:transcriptional regulator [Streptomyces sp. CB01881]